MNERVTVVNNGNICTVCNRIYPHRRVISPSSITGLLNIQLVIQCPRCRNLIRRHDKLVEQIADIDWQLYALQYTNYFD